MDSWEQQLSIITELKFGDDLVEKVQHQKKFFASNNSSIIEEITVPRACIGHRFKLSQKKTIP